MCGLAGELRFDGRPADADAVRRMLPALASRGPDGEGFFERGPVAFLKAYHRWGSSCVKRFLGMFAFAILSHESSEVVLARDRLGVKPLYLAGAPGRLRFASTLPALLAAGDVDTSIDKVALQHYMTFHSVVPAPRTILSGVRKLPPATIRFRS